MSIRSLVLIVLWAGMISAQENLISIAFEDLPQLIEKSSPHSKILHAEYDAIRAESDIELQWSNPELNYDFEQVKYAGIEETEQSLFLSKSFDLPWIYIQDKKIRHSENSSAGFQQKQNSNHLLANTRTGYVRLGLLKKLTGQMTELTKVLNNLQQTLLAQQEEGAFSRMDASLLSMGLFKLECDINETKQKYRIILSKWKRTLGIEINQKIYLADSIRYKNISVDDLKNHQLIENHPGLQARKNRFDAMSRRVTLENWKILPSFSLHGGYKKVDTNWEGFVLGVSLPLPLLNLNSPQIEKQKLEHQRFATETFIYKYELQAQIKNLVYNVRANAELFKKYEDNPSVVDDLAAAYGEGIISLTDFLNAIMLVSENRHNYIEQLTNYYQAVFELEALCGQQLVTF